MHRHLALLLLLGCGDTGLDGDTKPASGGDDTDTDDTVPPTEAGSWSLIDRLGCGQLSSANLIHVTVPAGYEYWILEANDQEVSCELWADFYAELERGYDDLNAILVDTAATVEEQCVSYRDLISHISTFTDEHVPPGSCTVNMTFIEEPSGEYDAVAVSAVVQTGDESAWAAQVQALGDCTDFESFDAVQGAVLSVTNYLQEQGGVSMYDATEGSVFVEPSERGLLLEGEDVVLSDGAINVRMTFSADAVQCDATP